MVELNLGKAMIGLISYIKYFLPAIWSDSPSPADQLMQATDHFGERAWKSCLGLTVNPLPIPPAMLNSLEERCPIWGSQGKRVKETHILCWIPPNLSIDKLNPSIKSYADSYQSTGSKGYWALITKKIIPDTERKSLTDQKNQIQALGYQNLTAIEAAIAIIASHHFTNAKPFYGKGQLTSCEESQTNFRRAIGYDPAIKFFITKDLYSVNGSAGKRLFA